MPVDGFTSPSTMSATEQIKFVQLCVFLHRFLSYTLGYSWRSFGQYAVFVKLIFRGTCSNHILQTRPQFSRNNFAADTMFEVKIVVGQFNYEIFFNGQKLSLDFPSREARETANHGNETVSFQFRLYIQLD